MPSWSESPSGCAAVRGDDLGVGHVPPPVEIGDVVELGNGPILLLRVVDLLETGPHSRLLRS
jgi:hypothetical protein